MPVDNFTGDPRTNRERMLAGDLYIADEPQSAVISRRAARMLELYRVQMIEGEEDLARETLTGVLSTLGVGAVIKPPLFVDYGENLHVGDRTFVNYNLTALDVATISGVASCSVVLGAELLVEGAVQGARALGVG